MAENCFLNIYIGNPSEDDWSDHLYLDLVIPGRESTIYWSDSLDDASGEDFLSYLEKAFNEASLYAKWLGLKIHVEIEEILSQIEDLDESEAKNAKLLLKELTTN